MAGYNESDVTKAKVAGGFTTFQTSLSDAINETYSYQTNSLFYGLIPNYYRTYMWRYIKVACEWIDGYVPRLHGNGNGIPSSRIANRLLTGITKNIVGERLQFKLLSKDDPSGDDTLKFIGKKAKDLDYKKAIYLAIGYAMGLGTSLAKENVNDAGDVWWEAVRFDQCFYSTSFRNEVNDAYFMVRNYIDTRKGKNNQQFYLLEHRFYHTYKKPDILEVFNKETGKKEYQVLHKIGERVPMVEYCVKSVCGTQSTNVMPSDMVTSSVKWDELPNFMKHNLKQDYSAIKLDDPQLLPFKTIGVYAFVHSNADLGVSTAQNFGESLIVPIQDDLITYELAGAYRMRDMYLGKGILMIPKSLSMGDFQQNRSDAGRNIYDENIGQNALQLAQGLDPENQKPIVNQFEVREEVWQKIQDDCIKRIATKWNMTPKIISSYLATTGTAQMTATQIDSEDDVAIAFINYTRSCFTDVIDKMLEETLNYYGKPANVGIGFNSPSLVNKDRLIERTTKKLDAGLIDIEDAVREINPDMEEEALQAQIDKVKKVQEDRQSQEFGNMDFGGGFGGTPTDPNNPDDPNQFNADDYEDLGGPNNNGSTNPIQKGN